MAGDPHFASMVLGIHCDGANNSTSFTDVKGHPITANGNAHISTAQYRWGSSSGAFDGAGDYLDCGDSADMEIGGGNFHMRAPVFLTGYSPGYSGAYAGVLIGKDAAGARAFHLKLTGTSSSWDGLAFSTAGSELSVPFSFALNTWYDVRVDKHGTDFRFFVGGTQAGATLTHSASISDVSTALTVGGMLYSGFEYHIPGNIQEVQIYKESVHTSDFTVPIAPFFDYAGQIPCTLSESSPITDWIARAHDVATGALSLEKAVTGSFTLDLPTLAPQYVTVSPKMGLRWAASIAKALDEYGYPTDLGTAPRLYKVTAAGTTGGSEPTWPTSGTVSDGSVTWTLVGDLERPLTHGPLIPG